MQSLSPSASCGDCTLCCTLLEVKDIDKPFITECKHVRKKDTDGCGQGCSIYTERPEPCRHFSCLWLASQSRPSPGDWMSPELRPDQCHVVFGPSGLLDRTTIFIHVDPKYPDAWLNPVIQDLISQWCTRGAYIVVVINEERILLKKGQPPLRVTEAEIARLRFKTAKEMFPSADRVQIDPRPHPRPRARIGADHAG